MNEFGVNNGKYIVKNWHGFLDYCYIPLDTITINSFKFSDILDNTHDNMKFTIEKNNLYLPFIDILINKDPKTDKIWTDIF